MKVSGPDRASSWPAPSKGLILMEERKEKGYRQRRHLQYVNAVTRQKAARKFKMNADEIIGDSIFSSST